jgi:hypothetical protein
MTIDADKVCFGVTIELQRFASLAEEHHASLPSTEAIEAQVRVSHSL